MAKQKNDTVLKALRALRDLLKDRKRWIKGANAKDEHGQIVELESTQAACFCLDGGLRLATSDYAATTYLEASNYLIRSLPAMHQNYIAYNDDDRRQHRHIVALTRRAVALRRADLRKAA